MIKRRAISLILTLLCCAGLSLTVSSPSQALNIDTSQNVNGELFGDCSNVESGLGGILGCENDDGITDLTDYSGSFEGPDAAGYDEGLTQTDNVRDFIQMVVNFALGFLGLIAVLVVIYGGVLYVTSRGDTDATEKGKKSITFAMMGIVIVLGSFALVNTLFTLGGGSSGSGGSATGTTVVQAGAAFDVRSVLGELEDITKLGVEEYQRYLYVAQETSKLQAMELPYVLDLDVQDKSLSGLVSHINEFLSGEGDGTGEQYQIQDALSIDDYVTEIRQAVYDIQREVDSLSNTYEASQLLLNYLEGARTSFAPNWLDRGMNWLVPQANAVSIDQFLATANQYELNAGTCLTRSGLSSFEMKGAGSILRDVYSAEVSVIDDDICGMLELIQAEAGNDYLEGMQTLYERFNALQALFVTEGFSSGSSLNTVNDRFESTLDLLNRLGGGPDSQFQSLSLNANLLRNWVTEMDALYQLVSNLQFVDVRLSASTVSGSAPLIVRFDALGTTDPSGLTVEDDQIFWDLDGDGEFDDGLDESGQPEGSATSFIYTKPGTYRARVQVLSQDPNIAAGVATVNVLVEPAKSVIVLTAEAGGEETTLADYGNFPAIDRDAYKVTMSEAQDGLSFDASQSTDGNGNLDGIIYFEWDFGDNEVVDGPRETAASVTHQYGREGAYTVSLTVTDETGVRDRKIFRLFVASPAARLSASQNNTSVGGTVRFDGSASSSDIGTIVNYQWSASLNGQDIDLGVGNNNIVSSNFDRPGLYTVTLTVIDSSGKTDSTSVDVLVESQAPLARFTYSQPRENDPAVYVFDASESSDPDEGDVLGYRWDFGVEGRDYRILESEDLDEKVTIQFLNSGTQTVQLTVFDQHEGELQKTDTAQADIQVQSVLDVELLVDGASARRLNSNGEAELNFSASSTTATAFEIDFGDGDSSYTDRLLLGTANFEHTYRSADVYYVTLRALDEEGQSNSVSKRVYISESDSPIAVINVSANGQDVGSGQTLTGSVRTQFQFDASDSINVDGSKNNLSYSWNFGDGSTANQRTVTHVFDEKATFPVTLTVKDRNDASVTDTSEIMIRIQGIQPKIRALSAIPQGNELETPVQVTLNVDAYDEDGSISFVKFWAYDVNDSAEELGTVIAQSNTATITLNTKGEEGETVRYGFAAEVTDNDNQTVNSFDELSAEEAPYLEVINGPNDTPVASFSVDRSSIKVGEDITFNSTSYDLDGQIVSYTWDLEGDGFFNNEPQTQSFLTTQYDVAAPEGIEVKLRVEDNEGATASSGPVTIFVDPAFDAPVADFDYSIDGTKVSFENTTSLPSGVGSRIEGLYWDFDTKVDSNENGVADDDQDSTLDSPNFDFLEAGTYDVKLVVIDNAGQSDSITKSIQVEESTTTPTGSLKALLSTSPTQNAQKQVTIQGSQGNVSFFFGVEGGVGPYVYEFDKNIFFDTEGDGVLDNDVDFSSSKSGSWTTPYFSSYGQIVTVLTVTDLSTGQRAKAAVQVIFNSTLGGANLMAATQGQMLFLILSALLTAILGASLMLGLSRRY